MSAAVLPIHSSAPPSNTYQRTTQEPAWVRRTLIGLALAFLTLFLFVPLISVFYEAFKKGADVYVAAITDPDAVSAIQLTLTAAAIAVPLNLIFGLAA